MTKSIANFISYALNPPFVLIFSTFLLIFRTNGNFISALVWAFYSFFFLLFLAAFLIYGVHKGFLTDLDVSKRKQRPLLFIVSLIISTVYLIGLYLLHAPQILVVFTYAIILCLILFSIINTFIKASLHVATVSAFLIALSLEYKGLYFILLLFIPLVAWARVKIKRHSVAEAIVGGILGSLLSLGMYLFVYAFNL